MPTARGRQTYAETNNKICPKETLTFWTALLSASRAHLLRSARGLSRPYCSSLLVFT